MLIFNDIFKISLAHLIFLKVYKCGVYPILFEQQTISLKCETAG